MKSITKDLAQVSAKDLAQVAWNFINDSLRTTIALHYTPQCVAASAVYLASRFLGVTVPTRYEAINVLQAEVEAVAEQILAYYPDGEDPIERQQRRRQCGLASLVALSGAGRAGATMHAPAAPADAAPAAAPALAPEPSITISPAARQEEGEVEEGELEEGELSPGPKRPKLHAD